jgi:hypothetical protein
VLPSVGAFLVQRNGKIFGPIFHRATVFAARGGIWITLFVQARILVLTSKDGVIVHQLAPFRTIARNFIADHVWNVEGLVALLPAVESKPRWPYKKEENH